MGHEEISAGTGKSAQPEQEPEQRSEQIDRRVEVFDPSAGGAWDDDDEPEFDSGDQDYGSAAGWGKVRSSEELKREAIERDPRANGPIPEMFWHSRWSEWVDIGVKGDPVEHLFGPFWRADELAVLFAGTGTGKSALATQIAEALARGRFVAPFGSPDAGPTLPRRVLYLDFEQDINQCAMRYSVVDGQTGEFSRPYAFSPNLIRAELFWNGEIQKGYTGFSDMFFASLSDLIYQLEPSVVIVDNITFLDRSSTSNAHTSLHIMRSLIRLKRLYLISILVLAHTPKRRPWQALSELDLQGSINLSNFADSIFAIGRSRRSPDLRYVKQIKVRTGRPEYTEENVPVFELKKFDNSTPMAHAAEGEINDNFLGFQFVEFACEDDHLDIEIKPSTNGSRRAIYGGSMVRRAKRLKAAGKSAGAIARELDIPKTTVRRYLAYA